MARSGRRLPRPLTRVIAAATMLAAAPAHAAAYPSTQVSTRPAMAYIGGTEYVA